MCTAQGCALYSATGIIFMSMIGTMLIKQPFLISGIDNVELAKGNAFGAAGTFFLTFIISIMYMIVEGRQSNNSVPRNDNNSNNNNNINSNGMVRGEYSGISLREQTTIDSSSIISIGAGTNTLFEDDPFDNNNNNKYNSNPLPTRRPYRDNPEFV